MSAERTPPVPSSSPTSSTSPGPGSSPVSPASPASPPSKETPAPKSKHSIAHLLESFRGERGSGSSPLPSHVTPPPSGLTPHPSQLSPRPVPRASGLTPHPSQLSPRPSQLSPKSAPKRHISQVIETLKLPSRDLAERLVHLGFDAETACVLHILPLIQVAWANGEVSRRERRGILHVLKLREIPEGSRAWLMCESLLENRPTDAFLQSSREALRDLLSHSQAAQGQEERQLIDLCVDIAEASGGLFGLVRSVSATERSVIADIAATVGDAAQEEMRRLLR